MCNLRFFCCFLTDFDQSKQYALFRNNRIQRNIRKRNQIFGHGNRFRFIFGLKTSFETPEGRLNVSLFLGRQIISYNKSVVLVNLLGIE